MTGALRLRWSRARPIRAQHQRPLVSQLSLAVDVALGSGAPSTSASERRRSRSHPDGVVIGPTRSGTIERRCLVFTGLSVDLRELISGTVTEAFPQHRESSPAPSIWLLLAAIAVGASFLASIFTPWAVVWGSISVAMALVGWFWPKKRLRMRNEAAAGARCLRASDPELAPVFDRTLGITWRA